MVLSQLFDCRFGYWQKLPIMVCLNLLLITFFVGIVECNNIVKTSNGFIRGKSVGSGRVLAFLSIPYAEPPVGPLRFGTPVAKAPWKGVYNAINLPPPCIQPRLPDLFYLPDTHNISEDCLYLNIWSPRTRNAGDLKPILIFIHGGLLMVGSSNMGIYDGANLAEYGDIIVATINYRLGGLGFLYGYLDEAGGNMGMYDQVAAIRWIKENAHVFGGDPDNIVLMGQSAGGYSVSAHMISPLSKNLFRRVILLSGSVLSSRYNDDNRRLLQMSEKYANLTGCSTEAITLEIDPKSVIECMKRLPAQKFSEVDTIFFNVEAEYFFFRTGDDFLPESPINSFRKGNFKKTEVLLGLTRNEGALFLGALRPLIFGPYGNLATNITWNDVTTKRVLKDYIKTGFEFIDEKLIQTYMGRVGHEEGYTYIRAMVDAVGDYVINCGPIFQADFHSLRNDPVYFYMFDYRPPSTPLAEWENVTHFEDLPYYFGNPMHANFTEYEKRLSRYLMDTWITFIRTGNPNSPRSVMWPRYSYHDPKFLTIGEKQDVSWSTELNRCEFWRSLYGAVMDDEIFRNLRSTQRTRIRNMFFSDGFST